jgi:hypothetical protein
MPLRTVRLIPKKTLVIQLSWLGALVIFILVVILPLQGFKSDLEKDGRDIQLRIEEQSSLLPIYQALKTKGQATSATVLPTPERAKLSRSMVGRVPSTIKGIAGRASMEAVSILPDIASLTSQSDDLLMHAVIRGSFMNFRQFLIGVSALPYLERIETIEIHQDPDFTEYRMKIRLAMDQSKA